MYDITIRLSLNDSLISLYNFFWTSVTYLVPFALILFYLISQFFLNTTFISLLFIIIIYFIECTELIVLNYNFSNITILESDLNLLLSNNLNKYHPYILYTSSFILVTGYISLYLRFDNKYDYYIIYRNIILFSNRTLVWNFIALLLGSWWALQEGTWGGWWNWDTSEVLGLFIFILSLLFVHSYNIISNLIFIITKYSVFLMSLIIFFILLQLNFELTSHSFGSRLSYFFNTNFTLSQFITLLGLNLFYIVTIIFNKYFFLINSFFRNSFSRNTNFNFYILFSILSAFLTVIISTTTPLINYYVWRSLELNTLNISIDINLLVLYITFFLLILPNFLITKLFYVNILLVSLCKYPLIVLIFLTIPYNFNLFYFLHTFILITFHLNYLSTTFDLTAILFNYSALHLSNFTTPICNSCSSYSCSNFTTNYNTLMFNDYTHAYLSYNFLYKSNSLKLNNFNLFFDSSSLFNLYNLLNILYKYLVNFELPSLDLFLNFIVMMSVLFCYTNSTSYKSLSYFT